jgi:hypothetical protein
MGILLVYLNTKTSFLSVIFSLIVSAKNKSYSSLIITNPLFIRSSLIVT